MTQQLWTNDRIEIYVVEREGKRFVFESMVRVIRTEYESELEKLRNKIEKLESDK